MTQDVRDCFSSNPWKLSESIANPNPRSRQKPRNRRMCGQKTLCCCRRWRNNRGSTKLPRQRTRETLSMQNRYITISSPKVQAATKPLSASKRPRSFNWDNCIATKSSPKYPSPLIACRQVDKLVELIKTSRTIMSNFAKAKTAKIGTPAPSFLKDGTG